ncbi:MAG: carbonic anhydrase [Anaerolineaceae bacterium]|nr:carbonic anhydrase [Anaerolineaceae bacterium]
MKKLIDGIHRFQSGIFEGKKELFERLAKRQEPDALFITCSDSRVSPTLLTQTVPGDLFILRNAGNLIPPYGPLHGAEAAAIEYAIEVLAVKDVIVCGHTYCGAMKAVLDPASLDRLPAMKGWLTYAEATRRVMDTHYEDLSNEDRLEVCIEENVLVQIENLKTHPSVLAAMSRGTLRLHAWVYEIESGNVMAFDDQTGQYLPVAEAGRGVAERPDRLSPNREI